MPGMMYSGGPGGGGGGRGATIGGSSDRGHITILTSQSGSTVCSQTCGRITAKRQHCNCGKIYQAVCHTMTIRANQIVVTVIYMRADDIDVKKCLLDKLLHSLNSQVSDFR